MLILLSIIFRILINLSPKRLQKCKPHLNSNHLREVLWSKNLLKKLKRKRRRRRELKRIMTPSMLKTRILLRSTILILRRSHLSQTRKQMLLLDQEPPLALPPQQLQVLTARLMPLMKMRTPQLLQVRGREPMKNWTRRLKSLRRN